MYLHPEEPIKEMLRSRWGNTIDNPAADQSSTVFKATMDRVDPSLIVVDGMTVIYGLHGLDTNDASGTDVITSWLKRLTRGGRTTVIVIDHTGKSGGEGSSPIGAHHKTAMVQGTSLRADAIDRPMPGHVGLIRLIVHKDRPGSVREISAPGDEQVAAVLTMDSTVEGVTTMKLDPPPADSFVMGGSDDGERQTKENAVAQQIQRRIVELFDDDESMALTTREVRDALDIEPRFIYAAWHQLQALGAVKKVGTTKTTRFYLDGPVDYSLFVGDGMEARSPWDRTRSDDLDDYRR